MFGNLDKFDKCHPKSRVQNISGPGNFSLAMVALRGDGHSIVSLVAEVLVRCHEAATLFWPQKTASTPGRATDELYDDMVFVGGLR